MAWRFHCSASKKNCRRVQLWPQHEERPCPFQQKNCRRVQLWPQHEGRSSPFQPVSGTFLNRARSAFNHPQSSGWNFAQLPRIEGKPYFAPHKRFTSTSSSCIDARRSTDRSSASRRSPTGLKPWSALWKKLSTLTITSKAYKCLIFV